MSIYQNGAPDRSHLFLVGSERSSAANFISTPDLSSIVRLAPKLDSFETHS